MKKFKRLTSIILTLLLVIGMIPLSVFHVAAETYVSKVEVVDVHAPVDGETPYYWANTVGTGYGLEESPLNSYTQNGITWYCNDSFMMPTDTFEMGNNYTIRIELYRETGYIFPDLSTIPVTINGNNAYISYCNNMYAEIEYTFTTVEVATPKLNSIDIQVANFEYGKSTVGLTFTSQDPIVTTGSYGENGLFCVKKNVNGQIQPLSNSILLDNTTYYITYNIQVIGNYDTNSLEVDDIRMNGSKAVDLVRPGNGVIQATFMMPKLEKDVEEINSIALRLPNVPAVGNKILLPVVNAINGNEALIGQITMSDCYWGVSPYYSIRAFYQRINSAHSETFTKGKAYQLTVDFYLPDDYKFSEDFYAMLLCPEGELIDTYYNISGTNHLTITFNRSFNAPTKKPTLNKLELILSGYQTGKKIIDTKLNIKINNDLISSKPINCGTAFTILNKDMNLIKTGDFKENTQYYLACVISEHPNYSGNYKDLSKFTLYGSPATKTETYENTTMYFFKLPILKKLTITTQPKTTYAKEGNAAKVTIKASGTGLKHQWYIKNKGATKFSKSSITKSTYSVTMNSKSHERSVYCIVTDQFGNKIQSKTVQIRRQATITKKVASYVYAKKGAKASVKITALGDGLTYTWYVKNSGASKYTKSTVKTATYSVTMTSTVKGRRIYCVVKDKYGKTATSSIVLLREAVSIVNQPKTVTVKNKATAKVSVKASGDGLKYSWYIKNAGAKKYSKTTVTKSTYSTTMNAKSKNRMVYCVVTDKYGKSVKSKAVSLKMK